MQKKDVQSSNKDIQNLEFKQQGILPSANNSVIGSDFDNKPIGGGSKVQLSQYPDQNYVPSKPIKKPVKPTIIKKQVKTVSAEGKEQENNINNDQKPIATNISQIKSAFDEVPIGKSNFNLSQYPDGEEPTDVVETNFTLSQKLKSKAVKLRLSGFEELLNLVNDNQNSPDLADVEIGKLLKQSNPACLEKILLCFKSWIIKGKNWGEQQAKNALENGYINGKTNTKKITIQILDSMYEAKPDCIQITILNALKGKTPKTLAGYLAIINQILTIFGVKKMKYLKPYLPQVVRVITNQKLAIVKTQGFNVLRQAYKWLGKEFVDPLLPNLKEAIKKQLDAFWETYDKTIQMSAPKDIVQVAVGGGKGSKKIDAYEISDAADIFKKFNQKWSQSVLKAEKWSQKVRLMQQLIAAASIPKIANTDYRHINDMIKRLINDSNFNVVLMDLKILAVMSKGLRKPFSPVVKSLFSNVLGKFRDKKTQMIDETFNTLNEFMYCISIEDVIDDLKEGLSDKAPNMKVNIINWIGIFVDKKIQEKGELSEKSCDALKSLFNIFEKLLSDGTAEVRQTMVKNISKMKMLIDEDFFYSIENKMNKNLASKVNDTKENKGREKSREKEAKMEKDLSKSNLSMGKDVQRMSKTAKKDQIQEIRRVQSGGKVDISNDVLKLLPKMNDNNNWQNRKQAAQGLISLINQCNQKVVINCIGDLMSTLKLRINDPNKQLIKTFVQLTCVVFGVISEKEVKNQGKLFICALAQGLSDKNDINRKQIVIALDKIGDIMGRQILLQILGQFLEGDRQSRIQIINIILNNQDYLAKADIRDYPKGIISCLCDKNKYIRNLAERLLQKIIDKIGIQIFKNQASKQRPAFTKDLNSLLDKFGGSNNLNNSSIVSKGVSPNRNNEKKQTNLIPNNNSNRKNLNNKSLSKINKSFEREIADDIQPTPHKTIVFEGVDFFAPLKTLSNQRIQRNQIDERVPWRAQDIRQNQQEDLKQQMLLLIRKDLANKMLSFDYRKVVASVIQIIKICKDINQQAQIRQLYDIFIKWTLVRLWGGNPPIQSIIQLLPPIMSILEKKNLVLNDNDVDLVIGIIRQYFISAYLNEQRKVSESLYTIIKCLIALSSGQKVLKKVLKQFNIDLSAIHRHVRKQTFAYCKQGFANLVKTQMAQYLGNQDSLQQASKIKQLKNDHQFVQILSKRLNNNVLISFGFKQHLEGSHEKSIQRPQARTEHSNQPSVSHQSSLQNHPVGQQVSTNSNNNSNSRIQIKNNAPVKISDEDRQRSRQNSMNKKSSVNKVIVKKPQADFDLNNYPAPNPCSPLGKNLAKLLPPNQATINFFAALLVQSGQKISHELITHAKIIFGSILRSVIQMLSRRNQYDPNKIISQITLLQQAIKCKNIVTNIGDLLYHATNFALNQLVYEDQNKILIYEDLKNRGIDFKIQNFIKAINGVMLRILENGAPQEVTGILFTLLTSHTRAQYQSHKTTCLIIKCIVRVAGTFTDNCKPEHVKDYFLKINDYINAINFNIPLQEFNPITSEKIKPQDNVINSIKTTIIEIVKIYKSQVWTHYQRAMAEAKYPDYHISPLINFLNIPYPEKPKSNQNDELKKMNELLSKTKTFDVGIQKLKRYIQIHPDFSPIEYFSSLNYDQKFINMVIKSLEVNSNSNYRKTPNKSDIVEEVPNSEGNLQDKLRKLKMKVEQMHVNKQQVSLDYQPKKAQEDEKNGDRALQIKRRIDEMKNKMILNNSYGRPR